MGKLFPLLLALAGLGAGVAAGLLLPAAPEDSAAATRTDEAQDPVPAGAATPANAPPSDTAGPREYVRLSNQFVVPVLRDDRVSAMVILSLSFEAAPGAREAIFAREPKLRDALLQVLFDHANMGGFGAEFTGSRNLDLLRRSLTEAAQQLMPGQITEVLIMDMARQDV
ncbi:MAG: flagellar basal body-associated FliL family protein [Rhodosalinus sp.]|uniref:flagellar basal body-associated FliL family protein n=1 Tax=Rhodosalinus sp. TaxID=2047741 RepID=UPI0039790D5F